MEYIKSKIKNWFRLKKIMMLEDYDLGISLRKRVDTQNRARAVHGICGTITSIQILNHFGIDLSDEEIRQGIKDHPTEGTNQVNMVLFMSQYLDVTFYVNYDIKKEIKKGSSSTKISNIEMVEFSKLLNTDIHFEITPSLPKLIALLNKENALAQFVFLEEKAQMTHYGLLSKIENGLMEFTQRENETGEPDVKPLEFMKWWDLKGKSPKDPEQLVMIYREKSLDKN